MSKQMKLLGIPAAFLLLSVALSWAAGPSFRFRPFRMAMTHTGGGDNCEIESLEVLPLKKQVTFKAIDKITVNQELETIETSEKDVTQQLFDDNPGPMGGGKRIWYGHAYPTDKILHDKVLVRATLRKGVVGDQILFRSYDVDDPTYEDPILQPAGNAQEQDNHLVNVQNKINGGGADPVWTALKDINNSRGVLPVIDWENFCHDNRSEPRGGRLISFDSLTANEKADVDSGINASDFGPFTAGTCGSKPHPEIRCDEAKVEVKMVGGKLVAQCILQVSAQPGDNFRLLAFCVRQGFPDLHRVFPLQNVHVGGAEGHSSLKLWKSLLTIDQLAAKLNKNKQLLQHQGRPGFCRLPEVSYDEIPGHVKVSELLTVWRRVHLEEDHMIGTPWAGMDATRDDVGIQPQISPDPAIFAQHFNPCFINPERDVPKGNAPFANSAPVKKFLENLEAGNQAPVPLWTSHLNAQTNIRATDPNQRGFYWCVQLQAGYDGPPGPGSNDPNPPTVVDRPEEWVGAPPAKPANGPWAIDLGNSKAGLTGGPGQNELEASIIFHETIRDTRVSRAFDGKKKFLGVVTFGKFQGRQGAMPGNDAEIVQRVYLHETLHQFTDGWKDDHARPLGAFDLVATWTGVNFFLLDQTKAICRSVNDP